MIQNLITIRNDSENRNKSNQKKTMEIDAKIEHLSTLIEEESKARKLFNKDLEKRCSKIETGVETMKNDSKKIQPENAITKNISSENTKIEQLQSENVVAAKAPIIIPIKHTIH